MLKELEKFFIGKKLYARTQPFFTIELIGGFETPSGHNQTWEYHWVVSIHENLELKIPAVVFIGNIYENLDSLCTKVLEVLLLDEQKNQKQTEMFVDWTKFSMDELVNYLDNKFKFSSTGDAFAITKLITYYKENKNNLI